jgi:hypothetical protein
LILERSIGEFLRESAVLVGVFASLEPLLKGSAFGLSWVGTVFGVTIVLFLVGFYFTVRAERAS